MTDAVFLRSNASPIWLCVSALVFYIVLALPNHPAALAWDGFLVFPLELPVILIGLALLPAPAHLTRILRCALVGFLSLMTVIKFADFATYATYNRGFNPIVDMHLIPAAWNLVSGSIGFWLAVLSALALFAVFAGLISVLWWASGQVARLELPRGVRRVGALALLPCAGLAAAETGEAKRAWTLPFDVPGAAFTTRVAVERVDMVSATMMRLRDFRVASENDAFAHARPLLDRIGGRDVLVMFIESYGAANLTNPRYAPTHLATLDRMEADLGSRGLAMRSGWLDAPIIGGQSWLSHATLATGLWIPDQRTYGAALISARKSLFHLAQENGFETVAMMPAITLDWPEAAFMGFDRIFAAADLGYRGLPFNWVTMPDQFTLAALDRHVRVPPDGASRAPVFAQVALISSHAPWTPVPDLVAWDEIGDGTIFDAVALSGDPPEVVWRDRDRVRDQFRQAIDYSLQVVGSYAARVADDPPLMIVLGDHPPARFVSEDDGTRVPVHVIGPRDLVHRFADWGWGEGLVPDGMAASLPMDAFRDLFLATFSSAPITP